MRLKFKSEPLALDPKLRTSARTFTIRIGKFCMVLSVAWGPR